jgi:hypothetical protein
MFEAALHEGIDRAQEGLRRARQEGSAFEESAHAARLLDLIDRALSHGINPMGWVNADLMTVALASAGDT